MGISLLMAEEFEINAKTLIDFDNGFIGGLITVLLVGALILIANVLRRKVRFLRRSFIPSAVIAGLLGLVIRELVLLAGFDLFSSLTLSWLVYLSLPIAFIALCLREKDDYVYEFDKDKQKIRRVDASKSGSLIISTYLLQGLIGIGVTVFLCYTFMSDLNPASGIMLALGFGQGPQQAQATGLIWDSGGYFAAWGSGGAVQFGLAIAAFGFLWASIPGIILVNRVAKRKGIKLKRDEFEKSGDVKSTSIEGPDEIPLSESVDKFTIQVCMVLGVFLLTVGIIIGLDLLLNATGIKFLMDLVPTIWGFAFMIAALIALVVKAILRRLVKTGVMHRKYPNSYMMNRISGVAFDISITAALVLISIEALGMLWIPVIILSSLGGIGTMIFMWFMCRRIYKDYKDEAFLAMYGMLTGTIANGMILLREIDKDFKTPAGNDLVAGSSAAIGLGIPLLLLISQAPADGNLWWITAVIAGYFAVLMTYLLGGFNKIFRVFKRKKTTAADGSVTETAAKKENDTKKH